MDFERNKCFPVAFFFCVVHKKETQQTVRVQAQQFTEIIITKVAGSDVTRAKGEECIDRGKEIIFFSVFAIKGTRWSCFVWQRLGNIYVNVAE